MIRKEPILSIIIPMYNCAPVIERCLDSIDYPDAEIIVVNDGSTDNGANVIREYKQRLDIGDWRLKIVGKPNGGVSSARNVGIEHAQGKYISFIDADDFICKGGLQYIVELAENTDADVVKYEAKNITEGDIPQMSKEVDTTSMRYYETTGREALLRNDVPDYVIWDGIYRRDLIINNGIRFQENLKLHEDDVFMGMVYCHARKVIVTNMPLYCYVLSSSCSWTHGRSEDRLRQLIRSSIEAARYRSGYVQQYYPDVLPMEQLKQMRWVCHPRDAYAANMSLDEYLNILDEYGQIGIYPLRYKWVNAAYWYASKKRKIKWIIKTYICNHPKLAYFILQLFKKR